MINEVSSSLPLLPLQLHMISTKEAEEHILRHPAIYERSTVKVQKDLSSSLCNASPQLFFLYIFQGGFSAFNQKNKQNYSFTFQVNPLSFFYTSPLKVLLEKNKKINYTEDTLLWFFMVALYGQNLHAYLKKSKTKSPYNFIITEGCTLLTLTR